MPQNNKVSMTLSLAFCIFLSLLLQAADSKPILTLGAGGFGYGCGSNSPAVQVPFSFVRLGPDTTPLHKQFYFQPSHYGGYSDGDHAVKAFSHMHLVGAGVIDMGIFGFLPTIGPHSSQDQLPKIPTDNTTIAFTKEDEVAEPGYYSSYLPSEKIKVQLSTTQRCGTHRYSYHNKDNKPMEIAIMSSYLLQKSAPRKASTKYCGKKCIEGQIWVGGGFGGRFGGYTAFFHLEWISDEAQEKNEKVFLYDRESIFMANQSSSVSGDHCGAVIRTKSNKIELFVGISYVSVKNARINFQNELRSKNMLNFDLIRQQNMQIWKKQLSRFDIFAINPDIQDKIDTAIYRTLLTPTIFQDSNGEYLSFRNDKTVDKIPQNMHHVYTDMSLWDVHRSQMPWLLFHDPHRFADVARSLVLINRNGGYMPKWPFAQGATGCMIGAHATTVLADWIVKEAKGFLDHDELEQIYGYMLRNANQQTPHDSRPHIPEYISLGYLDQQSDGRSSCSETLQYSYNDFGISQIAKLMGDSNNQKEFLRRSKFYKNVFNPKTKFFEPRNKNGTFVKIKNHLNIFSNHYTEGDAWHYRFYAPHDAEGLINLFGSQKQFVKQLNTFFARSFLWDTFWLPNPYYWAGNQHDLFSVWLFPYANRTDLTQKYSRAIIDNFYGTKGNGLPGNDDYATMSAWLVFASLGFYPLPSTQQYVLGSPYIHYGKIMRKFDEETLMAFKIRVNNNGASNIYVNEVRLNGKVVKDGKFIYHSDLNNGYLQFDMKSSPKSSFLDEFEE